MSLTPRYEGMLSVSNLYVHIAKSTSVRQSNFVPVLESVQVLYKWSPNV